jgi:hypothetical protein
MGGLAIFKAEAAGDGSIIADRRLYRTSDNRIVEAGDADARFLFAAGAGDVIPVDQVKAFRLEVKDGKVSQGEVDPDHPSGQMTDADKDAMAVGLKKAADANRVADAGRSQTQVAVTEPPPVDEDAMAAARARSAADAKPVPQTATAPANVPKAGKKGKHR